MFQTDNIDHENKTLHSYAAVQSQKASKQILPFGFAELYGAVHDNYNDYAQSLG